MGKTISEKILARACGVQALKPGDIVWAKVDLALMHDSSGPRRIAPTLEKLGAPVWNPDKVVIVADHFTPPCDVTEAEIQRVTRDWAQRNHVRRYHEGEGICHIVVIEKGYVAPGMLLVGADSHTGTAGALGAFAVAIGSTEMAGVLVTGEVWLRVPKSIKVVWEGTLPPAAMAKDMFLKLAGDLGVDGAAYQAVEYSGSTVAGLPLDERLVLTNMAIEVGAKTGIMAPDQQIAAYLKDRGIPVYEPVLSDEDAGYSRIISYRSSDLEPLVACPHSPDNVRKVSEAGPVPVQQAYLGGCTGGKYFDLVSAARILKNRVASPATRLLVAPASRDIMKRCLAEGVISTLVDAGATILPPSCGACAGLDMGILAQGERCISSTNRNFKGRMGHADSEVYLASPMTVAASAVKGVITDPREFV
ncbi:MAG: 3-isopropylmalate dehydratase large subunit [Dehalococcoidia bacterium]|nr:3-isopropylmalate dehydratase large subunit [Dehalococcoidia bacterium]